MQRYCYEKYASVLNIGGIRAGRYCEYEKMPPRAYRSLPILQVHHKSPILFQNRTGLSIDRDFFCSGLACG